MFGRLNNNSYLCAKISKVMEEKRRFSSYGPFSEEEAISRIDKFEEELAKGEVKWMRIDDIHAELKKLHPWL